MIEPGWLCKASTGKDVVHLEPCNNIFTTFHNYHQFWIPTSHLSVFSVALMVIARFRRRCWFSMLTKNMRKASTLVEPHHASLGTVLHLQLHDTLTSALSTVDDNHNDVILRNSALHLQYLFSFIFQCEQN